MSGTSGDGLDLACCQFEQANGIWTFTLEAASTVPYSEEWRKRLLDTFQSKGDELADLHSSFGRFIGNEVRKFIDEAGVDPEAICSHGHTIFHQPAKGYTFQAGCGANIAAITGIDTVCDFRTSDIANGGQGAPLVPVGDKLLFAGHKFCLNLGGFSNISFDNGNSRIAFDIGPANIALNYLARKNGKPYDENGEIAASGRMIPALYDQLNRLDYYASMKPKSLGREWFESVFKPLLNNPSYEIKDLLYTVTHHIAHQIAVAVPVSPGTTMLITGGGAFNGYLMDCLAESLIPTGVHPVIPDDGIVAYKEAIIFAFLGALRVLRIPNALSSATGATTDSTGGAVYAGRRTSSQELI